MKKNSDADKFQKCITSQGMTSLNELDVIKYKIFFCHEGL